MNSKFLAIVVLGLATLSFSAQAESVSLVGNLTPTVGSSFDIDVQVTDVFATHPLDFLSGFGFDVVIDPLLLTFDGATVNSTYFTDVSGVFGPSPEVAGFGFVGEGDFTEPLTLATLHFTSLSLGPASITITSDPQDTNQGLQYAFGGIDMISQSVTVTSAAPTPEPATWALGGLALAALAFYRRRLV